MKMNPNKLIPPKIQKHHARPSMSLHSGKVNTTEKFAKPQTNNEKEAATVLSSMGKLSPNNTKVTGPIPIPYPSKNIIIAAIGSHEICAI